jgi:hypothetical protein
MKWEYISKTTLSLFWLAAAFVALVLFYIIERPGRGVSFSSANDEWEHQTLAVNYAKGQGVFRLGFYLPADEYRFETYDDGFPVLRKLNEQFPMPFYYRNAGTSLIQGCFYRLFGVNPHAWRVFQFFLAVFVWWLIGLRLRKRLQTYRAAIWFAVCGLLFLCSSFLILQLIGDESLLLFSAALIMLAFDYYLRKPGWKAALLLTCTLCFTLFLKSIFILMPASLLLVYMISGKRSGIWPLALVCVFTYAAVHFYSEYINRLHRAEQSYPDPVKFRDALTDVSWTSSDSAWIDQQGWIYDPRSGAIHIGILPIYSRLVSALYLVNITDTTHFLMSQQALYNFIHGNNRYAAGPPTPNIGSCNQLWCIDTADFYQGTPTGAASLSRVAAFYLQNPLLIPPILINKLHGAFWGLKFNILLVLVFAVYLLRSVRTISLIWTVTFFVLPLLWFDERLIGPLILLMFPFVFFKIYKRDTLITSAMMVLANILLVTLLLHGINRFTLSVQPATFLLILLLSIELLPGFFNYSDKGSAIQS